MKAVDMNILSVNEMKSLEEEAFHTGTSYESMIDVAGSNLAKLIYFSYKENSSRFALGLVGSGKNGADTITALNYLLKLGWQCVIFLVKPRAIDDKYLKDFNSFGGSLITEMDQFRTALAYHPIILDGILGTGYHSPMETMLSQQIDLVIQAIDSQSIRPMIIAMDCPSGIDCDTGEISDPIIKANITACMGAVKVGLLTFPAFEYCGDIELIDIGLTESLRTRKDKRFVVTNGYLKEFLPQRKINSHKGTFGKCAMLVGSERYPGAAYLAGKAAYLSGTGLVTILSTAGLQTQIAGQLPEATWVLSSGNVDRLNETYSYDSFLIGSGMGLDKDVQRRFLSFIASWADLTKEDRKQLVVDADGLRMLSSIPDWFTILPDNTILTPHPGEMAFITGLSIDTIQLNRWEIALEYAQKWQKVIVLKGALSVVAEPHGRLGVIPIATSALATAGTGDVLAGLIAGFCAQKLDSFNACLIGSYIHAQAGKLAEKKFHNTGSITALDILREIPEVQVS